MGVFDRFRKKKNEENLDYQNKEKVVQIADNILMRKISDGRLQIEHHQREYNPKYAVTLLTINSNEYVGGYSVFDAYVAWQGKNDCIIGDDNLEVVGTRREYERIFLGIDMNNFSDAQYWEMLMGGLLEKARVQEYVANGLKENPNEVQPSGRVIGPCGRYVGEVTFDERKNRYTKHFTPSIARAAHDTPEMQQARAQLREKERKQKEDTIRYKEDEIRRLQREISNLKNNNTSVDGFGEF